MYSALYKSSARVTGYSLPIRAIIRLDRYCCPEYLQRIYESLAARFSSLEATSQIEQLKKCQPKIEKILQLRPERENLETFLNVLEDNFDDPKNYFTNIRPDQSNILKQLEQLRKELDELEESVIPLILRLPNEIDPDVLSTSPDQPFQVIKETKPLQRPTFKLLDHVKLSYINFGHHTTIIGPQSKFILGDGAKLHLALTRYASSQLLKSGFIPFIGLDFVKSAVVEACDISQGLTASTDPLLIAQGSDLESKNNFLHLVGESSLESLAALLSRRTINTSVLPLRLSAIGSNYSRSLEQFHSVHCISITADDDKSSSEEMASIESLIWSLHHDLNLPCRLIKCGPKMLLTNESSRVEIQVYLPSTSTWHTSGYISNHREFTPLRLGRENYQLVNGSAINCNLLVAAIMENKQREDGTFETPELLEEQLIPKSF